jgi:hypothetical protein
MHLICLSATDPHDRAQRWVPLNSLKNLRITQMVENFLTRLLRTMLSGSLSQ